MRMTIPIVTADVPNANGVVYPREALKEAVKKFKQNNVKLTMKGDTLWLDGEVNPGVLAYAFSLFPEPSAPQPGEED